MARSKAKKHQAPTEPFIPDPPEPELGDDRFARSFKAWREWHTAVNFLTNLHIGVDDSQVFCSPQDPPDVLYRDAAFEVKEIMDKGRLRHAEVKEMRQNLKSIQGKQEAPRRFVINLLPMDAASLVQARLNELAGRYKPDVKAQTDILFYINKHDHWFDDGPMPSPERFAEYGWRSVSAVVSSSASLVFYAAPWAPQFLQANAGLVRERHEPLSIEDAEH